MQFGRREASRYESAGRLILSHRPIRRTDGPIVWLILFAYAYGRGYHGDQDQPDFPLRTIVDRRVQSEFAVRQFTASSLPVTCSMTRGEMAMKWLSGYTGLTCRHRTKVVFKAKE